MIQSVTAFLNSGLAPAVECGIGGKQLGLVGSEGRIFCQQLAILQISLTLVQRKILQPLSALPTVLQAGVQPIATGFPAAPSPVTLDPVPEGPGLAETLGRPGQPPGRRGRPRDPSETRRYR